MAAKKDEVKYWVIAEAALFAFIYYVQYLLKVEGNLWVSTLILGVLLNVSIIMCPVVRKCCK